MITLAIANGVLAGSYGSAILGTHARSLLYTAAASGSGTDASGSGTDAYGAWGSTYSSNATTVQSSVEEWSGSTHKTDMTYSYNGHATASDSSVAGTSTITRTYSDSSLSYGAQATYGQTAKSITNNTYFASQSGSGSGATTHMATGNDGDTSNTTLQSTTTITSSGSYPTTTSVTATQETLTATMTSRNPATGVKTATFSSFGTKTASAETTVFTTRTTSAESSVVGTVTTPSTSGWETVNTTASATVTTLSAAVTKSDASSSHTSVQTAATSSPFSATNSNGLLRYDSTFYPKGEGTRQIDTGIWLWKARAAGGLDSSLARFSDLFESSTGDTIAVGDFRRSRMQSRALQVLAYSKSTATISITERGYDSDGAYTGTFTSPATTETVWINGAVTTMTATAISGSVAHTSLPANTFETTTQVEATTADAEIFTGASHIGSTVSTGTYLFNSTMLTASSTLWTYSFPVSFYTSVSGGVSQQWSTSSSSTADAGLRTSFSTWRPTYFDWSGTDLSTINRLRKHTDTILIASYSHTGTGSSDADVLLGYKTTTSERMEAYTTTATVKHRSHTVLQSNYGLRLGDTDNSEATESSSISENVALTAWQGDACGPTWAAQTTSGPRAIYRALPNAYVGFGGTFLPQSLSPHMSTSSSRASGSDFGGALKMQVGTGFFTSARSAYPDATFYPIRSDESPVIATTSGSTSFSGFGSFTYSSSDSLLQRARPVTTYVSSTSNIQVAATWTNSYTTLTGTTETTLTSTRLATYEIGLSAPLSGEWHTEATLDSGAAGGVVGVGSTGGFALGHNALPGSSYTLFFGCGYVQWREYASTDTPGSSGYTGGSLHSTSDSMGSVSFTAPNSHAIVYTAEPLFSAGWTPAYPASAALPISKFYPDPAL